MTRPTPPTAKNVNLKRLARTHARTPWMTMKEASQKRLKTKKKAENAKAAKMKEVMAGQAAITARYHAEQKAKQEREKKERMAQEAKEKRERQRIIRSMVGVKMPRVLYKNLESRYGPAYAKTFRANVGNLSKE